jgi:hypothetical protein
MLIRLGRISVLEESSFMLSVGLEAVLDVKDDMDAGDSGRGASDFEPSRVPAVELAVLVALTLVVEDSDDETEVDDGVESKGGLSAHSGLSSFPEASGFSVATG